MRNEKKTQLPACGRSAERVTQAVRSYFRTRKAAFKPADLQILSEKIAAAAGGCKARMVSRLLSEFLHLPFDEALCDLVCKKAGAWLPVLRTGVQYCEEQSPTYARIPQTVYITDPEFDPESGKWSLLFHIQRGPLAGNSMTFSVSRRQAEAMLNTCLGPKQTYALEYPRPYDLHGLRMLVGFRRSPKGRSGMGISNFYSCSALLRRNRSLEKRRLRTCEKKIFRRLCFDCGAGEKECQLARHTNPLADEKECVSCQNSKRRTNRHGLCTGCTETLVKEGIPPKMPNKKEETRMSS